MKKSFILFIIFAVLISIGCVKKTYYIGSDEKSPKWVFAASEKKPLSCTSMDKVGPAGMLFAKKSAENIGKNKLGVIIDKKIRQILNNIEKETGIKLSEQETALISTNSVKKSLENLLPSKSWVSKDRDLYALMIIDADFVKKTINAKALETFKKDPKVWKSFEELNGSKILEKQINDFF